MLRLMHWAVLLTVPLGAAPAMAQDNSDLSVAIARSYDPALKLQKRGFAFPVIDYSDTRGAPQQRKGIIASKQIAPGTLLGIGLFETAPKARNYNSDPLPTARPKRSRQAAVGLSWRF